MGRVPNPLDSDSVTIGAEQGDTTTPYGYTLCLDGGPVHAWQNTGMDIVGTPERCVYTARCVWCGKTAARKRASDRPYRSSVRIHA